MYRKLSILLLAGVVAVTAGCGTSGGKKAKGAQPDWVMGTSSKYSPALYIIGRGQASSQNAAKDRARADIAKTLEVSVREISRDVTSFERNAYGDVSSEMSVSRDLETQTKKVIQGIQIADIWHDKKTGEVHALAILSRSQATNALTSEVQRLDQATREYIRNANNSTDKMTKMGFVSKAISQQLIRDEAQRKLQVVDRTGQGVESPYNSGKLFADLDDIARSIKVKTQVEGNDDVADILAGGVSAAGFSEVSSGEDYVMIGKLDMDDLGKKDGWLWMRGTFSVKLMDASGNVFGNKRWSVKTSAQDSASAKRRAADKVSTIVEKEMRAAILAFALKRGK